MVVSLRWASLPMLVMVMFFMDLGASVAAEKKAEVKVSKGAQSKGVEAIVKSNNQFALDLYAQLQKNEGNLFFSPSSISMALAMTYAGAEGQTAKEIATTLRFTLPQEEVHSAFASLLAGLNAPERSAYQLRIANRLWGQTGYGFLPAYVAVTGNKYNAELAQLDFRSEADQSRRKINSWVEMQTDGKIKDLLPSGAVNSLTRLVLTNAIYFKGKWEHQFDENATKNAPFTLTSGQTIKTPLMSQKKTFKYGEAADLQLLEMSYQGDDLAMLILLPKKIDGLSGLERQLSHETLQKWSSGMRKQEVLTSIPKFRMTEQLMLNSLLSDLGMPSAFVPGQANFAKMNGRKDLFLNSAVHKAFVEVNEEGTEAAAATGLVVGITSVPPKPVLFRADHPFVFMIKDQRTGVILFMGRVENPQG